MFEQLLRGLQGNGSVPSAGSYSTPQIKSNQTPAQNSWSADGTFQLGYQPSAPPAGFTPSAPAPSSPAPSGQMPSNWSAYLDRNPDVRSYYQNNPAAWNGVGQNWDRAAQTHYERHGQFEGRPLGMASPAAPQVPLTVNVGGGAYMPTTGGNPFVQPGKDSGPQPMVPVKDFSGIPGRLRNPFLAQSMRTM